MSLKGLTQRSDWSMGLVNLSSPQTIWRKFKWTAKPKIWSKKWQIDPKGNPDRTFNSREASKEDQMTREAQRPV